ncbi:MAG TPA: mechanosensitive ion channel domain-containing protein [Alkalispirochaeta sp.]|nr:mechanosensitive ion channel domain-containing protein [Alkalispirochaeta sp.]
MAQLMGNVRSVDLSVLPEWEAIAGALLVLLVGFLVLRITIRIVMKAMARGMRDQSRELLRKTLLYVGAVLLFVMVLNTAGVSVGALLGAAGVVGIAVGIASQASLSNVISGFFLVSERFFEIGDVVRIGENTGTIASIDLLSVKVKTFDNILIRVPNQRLIEQDIFNITRFPLRRMQFTIVVPTQIALAKVFEALETAAGNVADVLQEPEPFIFFRAFTENGSEVVAGVWFERQNFIRVRNDMAQSIQSVFSSRGIPIRTRAIALLEDMPQKSI